MAHTETTRLSRSLFLLSGFMLVAAATAHLITIWIGPAAYSFMGAGPDMARRAAAGDRYPAIAASTIGIVLLLIAYYAFAAARLVPRPPLLRVVLFTMTALLLGRGAIGIFLITLLHINGYHMKTLYIAGMGGTFAFWVWSSALCLLLGGIQLAGTAFSRDLY